MDLSFWIRPYLADCFFEYANDDSRHEHEYIGYDWRL